MLTYALIVEKEKGMVAPIIEVRNENWASNSEAIFISFECGSRHPIKVIGIGICVEGIVSDELIKATVIPIGAGAGYAIEDTASRPTILCRVGTHLNLHLLYRFEGSGIRNVVRS